MSEQKGFVILSDIVNPTTGLTDKQVNLAKKHTYPLDSIVKVLHCTNSGEMVDHEQCYVGRVLTHARDCDGTPLYNIGHMTLEEYLEHEDFIKRVLAMSGNATGLFSTKLYGPISEDSLKLIAVPEEVVVKQ